jgi:hypothetical protein
MSGALILKKTRTGLEPCGSRPHEPHGSRTVRFETARSRTLTPIWKFRRSVHETTTPLTTSIIKWYMNPFTFSNNFMTHRSLFKNFSWHYWRQAISLAGAGRGALVSAPQRPCQPWSHCHGYPYLSQTQNILPFTKLVLKLVVSTCVWISLSGPEVLINPNIERHSYMDANAVHRVSKTSF